MGNGVFVISAEHDGVVRGFTATWVTQASYEHPLVMASFSKSHDTYALIVASQSFTINVLAPHQVALARHFGLKKNPAHEGDYFARREGRPPVLRDALAALQCRVMTTMDAEDHTVFLARVEDASVAHEGSPLLYWPQGGYVAEVGTP